MTKRRLSATRLTICICITLQLDAVRDTFLFQIGQEALTNALHHAQAGRITLTLIFETGWVRLQVEDNGQGLTHRSHRAEGASG